MLSFLLINFLVYFLTYLSTASRTDPFHFQAGGHSRRPNLASVYYSFYVVVAVKSDVIIWIMFAFVVLVSVFQY